MKNISRRIGAFVASLVLASAAGAQARPAYALADVHGAYPQMLALLQGAGLTDAAGHWAGGDARLVLLGDMIDRGAGSRDVLDLLIRLQPQARAAGGQVEVLLGNHEVMNLLGDVRYVSAPEFAAFAADETPAERDAAFQMLRPMTRAAFDAAYPSGYFGHRKAFAPDGRYGRWLLARPAVAKMEGVLLLHGGLSPAVTASLPEINRAVPAAIRRWLAQREVLAAAGRIGPYDDYRTTVAAARKLLADSDPKVKAAAGALVGLADGPWIGRASPVWHRGNALCTALLEAERVDRVLARYQARAMIVGHTPSLTGQVSQRWGGKLVRLDIGFAAGRYRGPQALLRFDDGRLQPIDATGASPGLDAAPITVGLEALERSAPWLADCLRTASPTALAGDRYRLACDGETLTARFWPEGEDARRELAAFRLSEALGYGAVPMTVARAIDGRPGVIRHLPDVTPGLAPPTDRRFCDPAAELELLAEFDALIDAGPRPPDSAGFDADGRLVLLGNRDAFASATTPAPTTHRLRTTAADLRAAVADLLGPAQIDGLVQRAGRLDMLAADRTARARDTRRAYSANAAAVKPM